MRIYFPFRLFEAGDRDLTSFDREMIADISSTLDEIIVQGKLKNKNIVAQKVYHCLSMVGHHDLLIQPLRCVIWDNRINFSEHRIATFSR